MGLKKAWVYDSSIPASLAEELGTGSHQRSLIPGLRATSEEKQAALEMYSLSASGDLASAGAYEWPRISVASRAHELKLRMKKLKGRRSSSLASNYLDEDTQRELGLLSGFGVGVDKVKEGWDREAKRSSGCFPDSPPRHSVSQHKRSTSEPVVINTVDDLLRHLEKMGRLSPSSSSFPSLPMPTVSTAHSLGGYETEGDSGDSSFSSQSSTESESSVSDAESTMSKAPKGDAEADANTLGVENLVSIVSAPDFSRSNSTSPRPLECRLSALNMRSTTGFET